MKKSTSILPDCNYAHNWPESRMPQVIKSGVFPTAESVARLMTKSGSIVVNAYIIIRNVQVCIVVCKNIIDLREIPR